METVILMVLSAMAGARGGVMLTALCIAGGEADRRDEKRRQTMKEKKKREEKP